MNQENGSEHHDTQRRSADAREDAGEHCDCSRYLRQSDQIAENDGISVIKRKASRSGASEQTEQDRASVIEERQATRDPKREQCPVDACQIASVVRFQIFLSSEQFSKIKWYCCQSHLTER